MSKDMLGTLVRKLVTLPAETLGSLCDLLQKLEDETWRNAFKRFLRREPTWVPTNPKRSAKRGQVPAVSVTEDWQAFYHKYFNLTLDLSAIATPTKEGFDRVIIVAQGLTLNRVYEVCKSKFPSWRSHENLDNVVPTNDRTPANGTYAITCRNRVEADEELQNLSARQLSDQGTKTMTLLERMIYELKYFDETGHHLDVTNVTLCAGSRFSDGDVPNASWNGKFQMDADWYCADHRHPGLRAREVAVSS